jgi:acyl-CoA thioesterase FadM
MSPAVPAFEIALPVEPADLDQLGHVNNVTYVRWVQEAAVAHWTAVAPAADQAKVSWIVLRHEIDYLQPAFLGDGIVARTWVGSASRVRFERFTELLACGRPDAAREGAHHVVSDRCAHDTGRWRSARKCARAFRLSGAGLQACAGSGTG